MARVENWRPALRAELMAARKRTWAWREHDCTTLAARCAQAITGEPYVERVRAAFEYDDARSAAMFFAEKTLRELVIGLLGDPVLWAQCREGDIVLCERDPGNRLFGQILTVHDGAQLLAADARGISPIPFAFAKVGWRL